MGNGQGSSIKHTDHEERVNFAKAGRILLDVGGRILRDFIGQYLPANNFKFTWKAGGEQKIILTNIVQTGSYSSCDISLLYAIIRNVSKENSQIDPPTAGWNKSPVVGTLPADFVERIRLLRNGIFAHAIKAQLSTVKYKDLQKEMRAVCKYFDHLSPCHVGMLYETELDDICKEKMTPEKECEYIDQLKKASDKFDELTEEVEELGEKVAKNKEELSEKIEEVDSRLRKDELEGIDKIREVVRKVDQVDANTEKTRDAVEKKIGEVACKIEKDYVELHLKIEAEAQGIGCKILKNKREVEEKVEKIDGKIERVDEKVDKVEEKLEAVDGEMERNKEQMEELEQLVKRRMSAPTPYSCSHERQFFPEDKCIPGRSIKKAPTTCYTQEGPIIPAHNSIREKSIRKELTHDSTLESNIRIFIHHYSPEFGILIDLCNVSQRLPLSITVSEDNRKIECSTVEWNQKCLENFKQCFKGKVNITEGSVLDRNTENILYDWCSDDKPAIFHSYNICAHLELLGYDIVEVASKLSVNLVRYKENNSNPTILYNPTLNLFISIRETDADTCEKIHASIKQLYIDIKLLSSLYKELFDENGTIMNVIGLLVLPRLSREELEQIVMCKHCKQEFILTKEEVTSKDMFDEWWSRTFAGKLPRFRKRTEVYQQVCSRIVGFLATKFPEKLPGALDTTSRRIIKMTLNEQQKEIVCSVDTKKHQIITGHYGCGKTIILQKILKGIMESLPLPSCIYYLCGDSVTLLILQMEEFADELKFELSRHQKPISVAVIKADGRSDASQTADITLFVMTVAEYAKSHRINKPVSLVKILENMNKQSVNSHLLMDEYDAEGLISADARRISQILCCNSKSNMTGSYVILIAQSMSKVRILCEESDVTSRVIEEGYKFCETSMNVSEVRCTMRNTVSITKLLFLASEVIQCGETEFKLARKKELIGDVKENTTNETTDTVDGLLDTLKDENYVSKKTLRLTSLDLKHTDHMFHMVSAEDHVNDSDAVPIISKFKIFGSGKCGHCVDGQQPQVLQPFICDEVSNVFEFNQTFHLYTALKETVGVGTVIICNDLREQNLVLSAMGLMRDLKCDIYMPSVSGADREYKIKIRNALKMGVIVTDHLGCRGLEFETVVVIVSVTEHYLAPFILESLSRCIQKLYFVLLKWRDDEVAHQFIAGNIIKKWQEENLVKTYQLIDCCTSSKCEEKELWSYEDEDGEGKCNVLCHHRHSDMYEEKKEKFEDDLKSEFTSATERESNDYYDVISSRLFKGETQAEIDRDEESNVPEDSEASNDVDADSDTDRRIEAQEKENRLKIEQEYTKSHDRMAYAWQLLHDNDASTFEVLLSGSNRQHIISLKDRLGNTLLHWAVQYNQTTFVKMLLNSGAYPLAQNQRGDNVLDTAKRHYKQEILNILQNYLEKYGLVDNGKFRGRSIRDVYTLLHYNVPEHK